MTRTGGGADGRSAESRRIRPTVRSSARPSGRFLRCLRRAVKAACRSRLLDHDERVLIVAGLIEIHMRQEAPAEHDREPRNPEAVPALKLKEPLSDDDRILQELYTEATAFWAKGFGRLKLIK